MADKQSLIPTERIDRCILAIRGEKVILDRDLAELYKVKPIALRQQVKRNLKRFPQDFMFQLTQEEADFLVSQNVIPSRAVLVVPFPMRLPSKALPCFPACSVVPWLSR